MISISSTLSQCHHCHGKGIVGSRVPSDLSVARRCPARQYGGCRGCVEVEEIDRKIESAQLLLNQLLEERESKPAILNEHHDPFTRCLPTELAMSVLEHSVPLIPFPCSNEHTIQYFSALHSLSLVCKRWRIVTIQTPSIWAYVGAILTKKNHSDVVSAVERALYLSKDHPLHVYLRYPADLESGSNAAFFDSAWRVLELLVGQANRWQVTDIEVPTEALRHISAHLKSPMVHLEHLHFSVNDRLADSAGCLLKLEASPRWLEGHWGVIDVGFDRLTRFKSTTGTWTTSSCLSLLQNVPGLKQLEFQSVDAAARTITIPTPFIHRNLETLQCQRPPGAPFWCTFSFPSLTTLHLHGADMLVEEWIAFNGFIDRSEFSIRSLAIPAEGIWLDLLYCLPQVTELQLSVPVPDPIISIMDTAAQSSHVLREITSLQFDVRISQQAKIPVSLDWAALIRFIYTLRSRRKSLRRIIVKYASHNGAFFILQHFRCLPKKTQFSQLLRAIEGINFTLTSHDGVDIVKRLRIEYDI